MPRHEAPQDELDALEEGRAFFDLSAYRTVRVTGADARAWLHDLVTSDVASLEPGGSQRSLLLTPTGRIRADLVVALDDEGFLLLQSPDQPDDVGALLARYVLSSDVSLQDVTGSMPVFALAGSPTIYEAGPAEVLVRRGLLEAGPDAVEVWRIRRGARGWAWTSHRTRCPRRPAWNGPSTPPRGVSWARSPWPGCATSGIPRPCFAT